jgi:hypothetical protein
VIRTPWRAFRIRTRGAWLNFSNATTVSFGRWSRAARWSWTPMADSVSTTLVYGDGASLTSNR